MIRNAPTWRGFLRALADEIDIVGGADARDALLRGVGRRLAAWYTLPPAPDVAGLEQEMNEHLSGWGWGNVRLKLLADEQALVLTHTGMPRIGVAGDPPGTWLSPVLEGLYGAWMSALPGAPQDVLVLRRDSVSTQSVTLRYAKRPVVVEPDAHEAGEHEPGGHEPGAPIVELVDG
jgi:hypothetical protein